MSKLKILNLYACLGGNRYKWGDQHEITAVEWDSELARLYQERFPNDTVIVADAHQYLLDHYKEFDFIWSSPPCPSHSRIRHSQANSDKRENYKSIYPDMKLYEEIIFLESYFRGKYVVENVIPFYTPLIPAKKRGRHLYWTNFNLPTNLNERKAPKNFIEVGSKPNELFHKIDLSTYKGKQRKDVIACNLVDYEAGKTIFRYSTWNKKKRKHKTNRAICMNSITIPSKVHNGTLVNNKGKINKAIKHFEGKEIEIVVKQRKKLRSHPQNSYYFGVIIPLTINAVSDEWGEIWDAHKTHDFYKTMFLYEEVTHYDTGEVIKIPKSSTDNSTIEQEQYHFKCIEFLKEWFNVYVPLPNEHLKNKLMIYNRDCLEAMKEMKDNQFDLAIVDPPYGIGYDGNTTVKGKSGKAKTFSNKQHHKKKDWDNKRPSKNIFNNYKEYLKNQIIWGGNYFADLLPAKKGWIYWDKKITNANNKNYSDGELAWSSFNSILRKFTYDWIGFGYLNNPQKQKKIHPTEKPIQLYEWLLMKYAKEGDTILDTHLGSGSIAIACHNLGFDLTGYEIDKEYFDASIKRIEQHKAQLRIAI